MPRLRRERALVAVLCHVWIVNAFVFPEIRIRRQRTLHTQSTSQQQPSSTVVVRQGSDKIQQPKANITDRLWTYACNIPKASRRDDTTSSDRVRPVHSLVHFLKGEQEYLQIVDTSIEEALERATIQAVRAASAASDYRLIFRVVEAAIDFVDSTGGTQFLRARLFGEAIESLSRTPCNASKLKQMWKLSQTHSNLIQEPGMGAFELNTMIRALASRGKIRAALDLYETKKSIEGDTYTMSALLAALTDSISDDQSPARDWKDGDREVSPCWQYTEAMQLLESCPRHQLNNHVFAAALRLSDRAGQVFDSKNQRHYSAKAAMYLLQLMKNMEISPDVVTCGLVASAFDKAFQYNAAVALLDAMVKGGTNAWNLPAPNEYVYSSVISACARCNEFDEALRVLNRMRADKRCSINTWVYNAALKACVGVARRSPKKRAIQSRMALTLLDEMERDFESGLDTAPDTVSYNTALAAIGEIGDNRDFECSASKCSSHEANAFEIVARMKQVLLPRDALTYHNAINSVRSNEEAVKAMLDSAIEDLDADSRASGTLTGRASNGLTFVFNSALAALSSKTDMRPMVSAMSKMIELNVAADSETVIHLLHALGTSGNSAYIPAMLQGLDGDSSSQEEIRGKCLIDITKLCAGDFKLELDLKHYSAAVKACVAVNDVDNALTVVNLMSAKGVSPNSASLEEIAQAYCRLAKMASAEESKIGRHNRKSKKKRTLPMDVKRGLSAARARRALSITLHIPNPSVSLLSAAAKACCSAGMWSEGRMLLGRAHHAAVTPVELSSDVLRSGDSNEAMMVLPGLHRSLLKLSASKGNDTAALGFVDDIQAFSKKMASPQSFTNSSSYEVVQLSSFFADDTRIDEIFLAPTLPEDVSIATGGLEIGMEAEDWKLLLIAASKAGNWRLCLGVLQFLKPFLEALHPRNETNSNRKWLAKRYRHLARSLTAAILCFEMRGQYAWAVRAIGDWVDWSGRRPRKEALLGTFRILATRGQGYEVLKLLFRVLEAPVAPLGEGEARSYEQTLCIGALNSLHTHGLYEDADALYLQACSRGYLRFEVERTDCSEPFVLDLHGMNIAMAHAAVRIALQQYALPASNYGDMVIVTGRGAHSAQRLRPVLRPEVQRMLLEEFFPPISTTSIPGNMGALRIPSQDVKEWVAEQRHQKGTRMLAVADVIRNLSSGERIRRSIALKLQTSEENEDERT